MSNARRSMLQSLVALCLALTACNCGPMTPNPDGGMGRRNRRRTATTAPGAGGNDYRADSNTLTFMPGETTKTVTVAVNGDTFDEADETVLVNLTNAANATITDAQGSGTITDNDPLPALTINDVSVTEGSSLGGLSRTPINFTVTLTPASGRAVSVNWSTIAGTAMGGSDYVVANGSVTFSAGETTRTITVQGVADMTAEPNETFIVRLATPTSGTIADSDGQATLVNDD